MPWQPRTPGKLVVQVVHAAVSAAEQADSSTRRVWKDGGQKKIVLQLRGTVADVAVRVTKLRATPTLPLPQAKSAHQRIEISHHQR